MEFGTLIDRYLRRQGTTVARFADTNFFDRAYVYRVRNGQQQPSAGLAQALDREFATTAFTALRAAHLHADAQAASRIDLAQVAAFRRDLDALRHLDDAIGSAAVRPAARRNLTQVTGMVRAARGPGRDELVDVAAGWAIFAGWVDIATAAWRSASMSLTRAWEWSAESANPTLQSVALTFQAYQALNRARVDRALSLAVAASRVAGAHPAQQAYTVLQRARVYAELGERERARPLLDQADRAIAVAAAEGAPPEVIYWSTTPFYQLHAGRTLTVMGESADAVAYLRGGLEGLPDAQARAAWTRKYRTALDHAVAVG
ncbi:hypothetical protein LO763_19755 [Glycomyces sp. A-F 0318]|uniref:hypothetical protein n=1 Tax=Glycomyces amatae TaxID=2881355 RepID=UPI001E2CEDFD|nr:hypothetical protein [Glycomyces amatae]MCD0445848.1 hypothetical protein [Glycomyces amatae]